jgi:excinuclease ABC subunit C
MLIYGIQEEVHRFSVSRSSSAKRTTLKRSSLEKINGIGPAKAAKLLREFGGLAAIKSASVDELARAKGISRADAENIFNYFNDNTK